LAERAQANASERDDSEWGYKLTLDPGATFEGRWRGETMATGGEYGNQRVFLFWDRDGALCFMYGKARLARKVDSQLPAEGDSVAVFRGDDEFSNGRTIHTYGLAVEPSTEPLPEPPDASEPVQTSFGDEAPW
jgi:hypothetical protein